MVCKRIAGPVIKLKLDFIQDVLNSPAATIKRTASGIESSLRCFCRFTLASIVVKQTSAS